MKLPDSERPKLIVAFKAREWANNYMFLEDDGDVSFTVIRDNAMNRPLIQSILHIRQPKAIHQTYYYHGNVNSIVLKPCKRNTM